MDNVVPASRASLLVSIVSTNDGRWLEDCLDSLVNIGAHVDVTLVANACDDNTEEICAQSLLDVTILRTDTRRGFAECNNLCLNKALDEGYEYIFLLNPDTQVHSDSINYILNFLRARPEVGIVGSIQIKYGDDTWSLLNDWSRLTLDHAATLGEQEQRESGFTWIEHDYVQGAAMMLRLSLVRRIGLLDPVYRTFYEETDICRRCLLAGHKVAILLDSKVQHFGGGNWKATVKAHLERDRLFLRNRFLFFVSGARSRRSMTFAALRILVNELWTVLLHREDVILSWWQYMAVIWSALLSWREISQLSQRNEIIRSGGFVPQSLWQIGSNRRPLEY